MRISVEAWSPEYSAGVDLREPEDVSVEDVGVGLEMSPPWRPVPRRPDAPGVDSVAFVDGTRRIDARVFVADGEPRARPGVAGSIGVGAVVCRARGDACARIDHAAVTRHLAVGGGRSPGLTAGAGLDYAPMPVPDEALELLVDAVHDHMRRLEADVAIAHAEDGHLVFADGPLAVMDPGKRRVIGYIKSHAKRYLQPEEEAVLESLGCGERTPLFSFGARRPRYSWYVRLCERDRDGHGWQGLVRCEVPAALSVDEAVELADASTALLPRFASKPHWDPRAPQNLVPIAGLEKRLRHLLGERDLVYRLIRSAAGRASREAAVA
ncbi:MAG TPA: DNA double-strand break repair nuclease NurA [Actinomycetota bacterium]|nr:DNA double-strand break repair nuclease NurA [Actinomycetota bacterium]